MTQTRLATIVLILAVVLSSTHAHDAHVQQDQPRTDAALRKKAFELLESVAGQLNILQSAENRARLGANILDSLWQHDERRARDLLVLVQEDINAGLDQKDQDTFAVFSKLRIDTAERIAKHDGESALAFFHATKPRLERPFPEAARQNEQHLELQLAKKVAASNPDAALNVGRKALKQGFSDNLVVLLKQLNRKNKEQATILYKEILDKIKQLDLVASDWDARNFIRNLAHSFIPPAADAATYREFVALLISSALKNGCGGKMSDEDERREYCWWAASLVRQAETFDPRVKKLEHWAGEEHGSHFYYELNELSREGTLDEFLELATKYPERAEDVYSQATVKARDSGDFEQARKIATRHITNPDRRQNILESIDFYEKGPTLDDQKLAQLETGLNAIENTHRRVEAMIMASQQLGAANQKTASKLLREASEIIDTMKPGREQTESQIALAMAYCFEKNDRGLSIMESLLPKLNELVDVAAKLDGYDTRYLRDGEWNMSANGGVGALLTRLSGYAGYFAWCDFDRSVSLTSRFDRPEIRLMAQVKLAQGILAGPPKLIRQRYLPSYRH